MSAVDELMPLYYELVLDADEPPPADPYVAKRQFARRLVERWHGEEAAAAAEAGFDRMFKEKRATDDAPVLELADGDPVHMPALLADNGLAASRGEARRLIGQGAVRLDGVALGADELDVPRARLSAAELRVGRRFARIAHNDGSRLTAPARAGILQVGRSGSLGRFFVRFPACPPGFRLVIFQVAPKARWSLKTQQFRGHRPLGSRAVER